MGNTSSNYENTSGYNTTPWNGRCHDCDAFISPSDGINSNYVSTSYGPRCRSCDNKREQRARKERQRRAHQEANDTFDNIKNKTQTLNNYIPCESESVIQDYMNALRYRRDWARIDYEQNMVHQHGINSDKKIYTVRSCTIRCGAEGHIIFYGDENNWPSYYLSVRNWQKGTNPVITEALMKHEKCPKCEQEMQNANQEFDTKKSEASELTYYIHITNDNCKNETRELINPSRFNNNWAAVDHELNLFYQHKKRNDKRIYTWKYCKIYCKSKKHILFDHNETNWPKPSDPTRNSFSDIEDILKKSECTECRNEIDAVKAKIQDFEAKQNSFLEILKEPISTEKNMKLSDITKLEMDLDATFKECKEAIDSVHNIVNEAKSLAEAEEGTVTYETQLDLEIFTKKAVQKQNDISKQKREVFLMDKQLNEKEILLIKNETEAMEQLMNEKNNKLKINEQYKNIDKLRGVLSAMMQNKSCEDIAGDEMQILDQLFDKLLQLLHEKYIANEQRVDELNKCKERIQIIRQKLEKQKGENKYLLELLDQEYNRLNTATETAMKKFEENGIYFLSVSVGLKENIIDKFVECGCDKLDDIKDMNNEDLIEIGIESNMRRKKILKQVQLLNKKFTENKNDE
eukprot:364796_1